MVFKFQKYRRFRSDVKLIDGGDEEPEPESAKAPEKKVRP
jgi:hypothetical protein